jgi:hypothetical protein
MGQAALSSLSTGIAGRQRAGADKIPDSQLVISPSMLFAPKILAARRGKKKA